MRKPRLYGLIRPNRNNLLVLKMDSKLLNVNRAEVGAELEDAP